MESKQNDYRDAKMRLINAGRSMSLLLENESFVYLLERLDDRIKTARTDLESSTSWEDFVEKRGLLKGVSALRNEIDTIISKGKVAERTLKTDLS